MPSEDIYAKCSFTRSGQRNIHFEVIIRAPRSKLEALRQDPSNRGLDGRQLFARDIAKWVLPVLYPHEASFSTGCILYPEWDIPAEISGHTDGQQVNDLTFWLRQTRYETTVGRLSINADGTMTVLVVIDSQQREVEDPAAISTEAFLRIVGCDLHFKDEKLYSLSLKVDPWPPHGFIEGSPLTVIIGDE
jgi:hypothetical protein